MPNPTLSMEAPITGILDQGIFKDQRLTTEEEHLAEKKLCLTPETGSVVSQDLFASCVPNNEGSPDPCEKIEEVETTSPDKNSEEDTLVPTLEDDQDDVEGDCLDKSILKSPISPEPNFLVNEDSMGFDHLQALNIVTPCWESTQSFMSILKSKVSPIKRRCFRDDPSPEPLNSTQTFFDISRHYKILSNERQKILYGDLSLDEENVNSNQSVVKPLRRKLFNDKEDVIEEKSRTSAKQSDGNYTLGSFEEEWEKVTVLKPNCQKQVKPNSICRTPDLPEQCAINKASDLSNKTDSLFNGPESLKTPDNRPTFQLVEDTQLDVCEMSVPAMMVEETVSTECEKEGSVTEVKTKAEETVIVAAVVEHTVVTDSENEVSETLNEEVTGTTRDDVTTHETTHVNKVQPVSVESVDHITLRCHNVETKEEENEPSVDRTSNLLDTKYVKCRTEEVESSLATPQSCKRVMCSKQDFYPENRIYKKPRLEEREKSVNCPELVQEMFRETGLPAAGFPSYPPEISKVVPIPIADEPIRKRTGLTRRSSRLSLHPYISGNTISVNEE